MPSEAKKVGSVNISIMESEEGDRYVHVTGDSIAEFILAWKDLDTSNSFEEWAYQITNRSLAERKDGNG